MYTLIIRAASGEIENREYQTKEEASDGMHEAANDALARRDKGQGLDPIGAQVEDEIGNVIGIWGSAPCMDETSPMIEAWDKIDEALGLKAVRTSIEEVTDVEDTKAILITARARIATYGIFPTSDPVGTEEGTTLADVLRAVDDMHAAYGPDDHVFVERVTTRYDPTNGHIIDVFLGS